LGEGFDIVIGGKPGRLPRRRGAGVCLAVSSVAALSAEGVLTADFLSPVFAAVGFLVGRAGGFFAVVLAVALALDEDVLVVLLVLLELLTDLLGLVRFRVVVFDAAAVRPAVFLGAVLRDTVFFVVVFFVAVLRVEERGADGFLAGLMGRGRYQTGYRVPRPIPVPFIFV
jgi:hypothetical protein